MPPDPAEWETVSQVAVKGAPYGVQEAKVRIRMEGRGDPIKQRIHLQPVVVYEDSGAMRTEDPGGMRCNATLFFIDQLTSPDEVGVLAYNETPEMKSALTTDYDGAKAQVECRSRGKTNLTGALRAALDLLTQGNKSNYARAVVLMGTGCFVTGGSPAAEFDRATAEKIKVFSIGIYKDGSSTAKAACEARFADWAYQTQGNYYWIRNPADLNQVYMDLANQQTSPSIPGWAPVSGLPMVRFHAGPDIEVVPGSFRCASSLCGIATPDSPQQIVPNNRGLDLAWFAPVDKLRIKAYWEVEFLVRSFKIGMVPLDEPGDSRIRYLNANRTEEVEAPLPALCLLGTVPTPPVVTSTYPDDGDVGVKTDSSVVVTFDQAMDAETTTASITVSPQVSGGIPSVWANQLAWSHVEPLQDDTLYSVEISTYAKTAAGVPMPEPHRFFFRTGDGEPNDPLRPKIVDTRPMNGDNQASVSASIVILFDQQMDSESTAAALSVKPGAPDAVVSVAGNELVYTHAEPFGDYTEQIVIVAMSAKSIAGASMASTYSFTFRTGSKTPVEKPEAPRVSFDPPPGATGVALDRPLILSFTEPMDRISVEQAFAMDPKVRWNMEWTDNNLALEITPVEGWIATTVHSVRLEATATSVAGVPMGSKASSAFSTVSGRAPAPVALPPDTIVWALRSLALMVIAACVLLVLWRYQRAKAEARRRARLPRQREPGPSGDRAAAARSLARSRSASRAARKAAAVGATSRRRTRGASGASPSAARGPWPRRTGP